ncbi:hypothetical protein LY78DRAFT_662548 [Colletotrichum sublineola]|nr:hypothetical protein LY78DRAFT_662548 [Colletotrichum sublineola]
MKHLAAYLLLGLGGNTSPSASDVKAVLESVGIEADDERLNKLISELEGKDVNEVRLTMPLSTSRSVTHAHYFCSSSPRALASSPPSPLVALAVLLPLLAVPPPLLPTHPLRRPRRRVRKMSSAKIFG